MGILDKIFRRKANHDEWLEKNPGKGSFTIDASPVTPAEQAATRARMEAELDKQNYKRSQA